MSGTETLEKTKVVLTEPKKYNIVIHNDDTTPMEFVIMLLMEVFDKTLEQANDLTVEVHEKGKGIVGTYTKEIAHSKHSEAQQIINNVGFELKITIEVV